MATFALRTGQIVHVDDEDFDMVSARAWHARPATNRPHVCYVQGHVNRRTVYLHRFIMSPPPGLWVDHINGDGLDNRRANLRICTPGENSVNRANRNATGYRGVYAVNGRWVARVNLHGRTHRTRTFATPTEAAQAYDELAQRVHGEFARLNFPEAR